MFTIKATYSDTVEIDADAEAVRSFFKDMKNYVDLMPGVEGIHFDADGIAHWKIRASIPVVGDLTERFSVLKTEDTDELIEWTPVPDRTGNFLRFSGEFEDLGGSTRMRFTQSVELRREAARNLHPLAGVAGESAISRGMSRHIAEMIKTFISKAKERLER